MYRTWGVERESSGGICSQIWSNWLSRSSDKYEVSFGHSEFQVWRVYPRGDATQKAGHPTWIVGAESELKMYTWEFTNLSLAIDIFEEVLQSGPN